MRTISAVLLIMLSMSAQSQSDQDILNQIKNLEPQSYEQTENDCKAWAQDDGVAENDVKAYVTECIIEQLGYLVTPADY